MKLIIAGSRDLAIPTAALNRLLGTVGFCPTEIVSGGARGIDACGEIWAKDNHIPCKVFPADWNKHGKKAGPLRNAEMAEYADALFAFPGVGKGTWGMIQLMRKAGKPVKAFNLSTNCWIEDWELETLDTYAKSYAQQARGKEDG